MKFPTLSLRTLSILLLLFSHPLLATERVLHLAPEDTEITFTLGATGHDVEGTLYLSHGDLTFDSATGSAGGEIAIDASKSESGNERRDKTMRLKVLESSDHPLIVFVPEELHGEMAASGKSDLELRGTLTLIGQDHPFTLPITVDIQGDQVQASSTFTVPYIAWGLHNPSLLFLRVAKEVEVEIHIEGALQAAADTTTPDSAKESMADTVTSSN